MFFIKSVGFGEIGAAEDLESGLAKRRAPKYLPMAKFTASPKMAATKSSATIK